MLERHHSRETNRAKAVKARQVTGAADQSPQIARA
jgi:hypothetical protein